MDETVKRQTQTARAEWLRAWKTGPVRTRWEEIPLQVGDQCPALALNDQNGIAHPLESFWSAAPTLFVFLRHFGCSATFNRLKALKDTWGELQALGVRVVAIVQAEPERTAWFAGEQELPNVLPILCDTKRTAYKAFGLLEGTPHQVLFRFPENIVRMDQEAGAQIAEQRAQAGSPLVDSPWQMPGDFLVDTNGLVRLVSRGPNIYAFPEPIEIQAALMAGSE